MLFSSYEFVLLFLPLAVVVHYYLSRAQEQYWSLIWILLVSLFFYGWWNPIYLVLLLFSILMNYGIGVTISGKLHRKQPCRMWLVSGIIFNLGLLSYFKYSNFFLSVASGIAGLDNGQWSVVLPLAISFFTFQQIAFLVDASQGKVQRIDLLRYAVFVSFFPQLIAGPIVHHTEIFPQLTEKKSSVSTEQISLGLSRFAMGLFKKVLIADQLGHFVTLVFDQPATVEFSALDYSVSLLAFSLQIYFDFSAYSDMAIGLGKMFGIQLPENFNSPYKARSIIDFWRRWHITLSRFLKNYLYIPLGGNRKGRVRRYSNLMLTMVLGGFWHGAGWQFLFWGGLHGLYLCINHFWRKFSNLSDEFSHTKQTLQVALTFAAVTIAWLFFRSNSMGQAIDIIQTLLFSGNFSLGPNFQLILAASPWQPWFSWLGTHWILMVLISLMLWVFLFPNCQQLIEAQDKAKGWELSTPRALMVSCLLVFSLFGLGSSDAFLYFQF